MIRCIMSGNRYGKHLHISITKEFAYFPKKMYKGGWVWLKPIYKESSGIFHGLSCLGVVNRYYENDPGITVENFYYLKENDYVIYASITHNKRTKDLYEVPVYLFDDAA